MRKEPKLKKCKICRELFTPQRPLQMVCGILCANKYLAKRKEVKEKRDLSEMKKSLLTHKDYLKMLQVEVNTIVRLIDHGQPCIATGAITGKRNAGHRASVGSNATIRFHLDNIHIQSEHSNKWKAGDSIRYDQGLERVYGKEYLEYVRSLSLVQPIKLSIQDIESKIKIARSIVKHLKLEDKIYDANIRLELRKKFNNMLGIYK